MAWKSTTLRKSDIGSRATITGTASQVVSKHRQAMEQVLLDAKRIADERRQKLDSIQDPELKRSAAR
ncbi:hypothetical protein [Xanthobacter sediminis]|uniref:hypothetical protein n=1 Tax=Xanthobacter sediminis TaxID=3119926 RepID=UPI00372CA3B7